MREAPSRVLIADLLARGATVTAYDPVAMDEAKHQSATRPSACTTPTRRWTPLRGADALAIVTEWKEFRSPDFDGIKRHLRSPVIFDGRNLYEPADVPRRASSTSPSAR